MDVCIGFGTAKMAFDYKKLKEKAREYSIEAKMKHILADIGVIDEKMKRLSKQREKLTVVYEGLKDQKIIRDAKATCLADDWQQGETN